MTHFDTVRAEYDIDLLVEWHRLFDCEAGTPEERARLIWEPTQALLRRLAADHPTALRCAHDPVVDSKDSRGARADIYIVTPGNVVACLGTVLNRVASQANCKDFLDLYSDSPGMVRRLRRRGPRAIIRSVMGCHIPVDTNYLDRPALADGVRRYMSVFMPALVDLPVEWLSDNEGGRLWSASFCEARRRARMSKELREHRISQEFVEY